MGDFSAAATGDDTTLAFLALDGLLALAGALRFFEAFFSVRVTSKVGQSFENSRSRTKQDTKQRKHTVDKIKGHT